MNHYCYSANCWKGLCFLYPEKANVALGLLKLFHFSSSSL